MSNWRWLAAPLSVLYGGVITLRHLLYDEHLLPSYTPHIPTICVGNLAVGGTGKTPMVEYLIRLLQQHGYKVGVLSRGYKRRTRGLQIADAESTAYTIGDEPMQIYSKFPDVTVVVCEDRVAGIKHIQEMPDQPDVVLLDDAYQHRSIVCGLNILLTAYDNLYVHDHLLPCGTLRDIPYRASKANIVVVTKCPNTLRPIDKRVVDKSLKLTTFQHLYFSKIKYEAVHAEGVPLLVASIARPEYPVDHVRSLNSEAEVMTYPDHYRFKESDVESILARAERCDYILTTEKDMQRLRQTDLAERFSKPVVPLPIRVTVDAAAGTLDDDVLSYVRESIYKLKGEK